jgi:hypothetical protein
VRFLSQLRKGDALTLRREPGNRHDPRAIRVEWRGAMLGYVPREANYAAAQLIDRGTALSARISDLRAGGDPRQRLMIEVSAEPPVEEVVPPSTQALDAMVRDPQSPPRPGARSPVTGGLQEKAMKCSKTRLRQSPGDSPPPAGRGRVKAPAARCACGNRSPSRSMRTAAT